MKVYVAVWGVYSSKGVGGVYDTPERAIAACHKPGWKWVRQSSVSDGREFVSWENDQDWDSAVRIEPFELTTEGPEQKPDRAEVVDYHTDHSRVIYTEEPV